MKIMLCNDTAVKAHIGCQAVSDAHARMLGRLGHRVARRFFVNELSDGGHDRFADIVAGLERDERFMGALDEVEAVVVNGEGTIHHGGGLALIAALRIAKRRGRAALLVNALLEEVPLDDAELRGFDHVAVREGRSFAYARSRGVECVQTFDSIVAADFSGDGPTLDGRIAVTDWTNASDATAGEPSMRLVAAQEPEFLARLFPMHAGGVRENWNGAVASLRTARLAVSSRHHGLYLAALANIPFVALKGRTWKVEGLLEALGGGLPQVETYAELRAAIAGIERLRPAFEAASGRLREAVGLQHFDILGRGQESSEAAEVERLKRDVAARPDLLKDDDKRVRRRREQEQAWTRRLSGRRSLIGRLFGR